MRVFSVLFIFCETHFFFSEFYSIFLFPSFFFSFNFKRSSHVYVSFASENDICLRPKSLTSAKHDKNKENNNQEKTKSLTLKVDDIAASRYSPSALDSEDIDDTCMILLLLLL